MEVWWVYLFRVVSLLLANPVILINAFFVNYQVEVIPPDIVSIIFFFIKIASIKYHFNDYHKEFVNKDPNKNYTL